MKFELQLFNRAIPDSALLEDLQRVAAQLGKESITIMNYREHGRYSCDVFMRRFGSWHAAMENAGLKAGKARNHVSDKELFDNIRHMWEELGRQPRAKEVRRPFSKFACNTYLRRFGKWQGALVSFVDYINSDEDVDGEQNEQSRRPQETSNKKSVRRTQRNISERLRFRILLRDGFSCKSCGRSPLKARDVELHVDHIIPWSKGGETIPDNLTTKCSSCNLGKGNLLEE